MYAAKNAVGDTALRVAGHFNGAVRGLPCSDLEGASAMCGSPGAAMRTATLFTPRRNQAIPGLLRGVQGVALVRPAAHHLQTETANGGPWRLVAVLLVSVAWRPARVGGGHCRDGPDRGGRDN